MTRIYSAMIILLAIMPFVGCNAITNKPGSVKPGNIYYFKDSNSGICFAAINSMTSGFLSVTSISCVPCDSVKQIIQ